MQQIPLLLVLLVHSELENTSYSNLDSKGNLFVFSRIFISNVDPENINPRERKYMTINIFCDLEKGDGFNVIKRDKH